MISEYFNRRVREMEHEKIPFIAYYHCGNGANGMSFIKLGAYVIKPKTDPAHWEGIKSNTLSPVFLRSLNKQLRELRKQWPPQSLYILSNLDPLTKEEQDKVRQLVLELED